jgi:hypothetical protein
MDKFNNIIVAAEQFSVQKYLRDVEEAFSLKQYSSDIFAAFRRQALLKIAPTLLRDVSGISSLQHPGAPKNLLLQNDTNEQISEEGGVNVRHREPNEFGYEFGNVLKSNWYRKFLHPNVRARTLRLSSRDRYSDFRSFFRLTLEKVEELTEMFIEREWCVPSRRDLDRDVFYIKTQVRILGALNVLGNHTPFRQLTCSTELSAEDHRLFFHKFINRLASSKDEFIRYPDSLVNLKPIMEQYTYKKLPGCGGSIDVVHLKWSNCPACDYNRCLGKEGFPTLAFEVVMEAT